MNKELISKVISYNYNEFGEEFGDCIVDMKNKIEDENERLNNIINELEKYINEEYIYDELGMKIFDASELQDKLQELKGSSDNG